MVKAGVDVPGRMCDNYGIRPGIDIEPDERAPTSARRARVASECTFDRWIRQVGRLREAAFFEAAGCLRSDQGLSLCARCPRAEGG